MDAGIKPHKYFAPLPFCTYWYRCFEVTLTLQRLLLLFLRSVADCLLLSVHAMGLAPSRALSTRIMGVEIFWLDISRIYFTSNIFTVQLHIFLESILRKIDDLSCSTPALLQVSSRLISTQAGFIWIWDVDQTSHARVGI
jgi:hypothetical protein